MRLTKRPSLVGPYWEVESLPPVTVRLPGATLHAEHYAKVAAARCLRPYVATPLDSPHVTPVGCRTTRPKR